MNNAKFFGFFWLVLGTAACGSSDGSDTNDPPASSGATGGSSTAGHGGAGGTNTGGTSAGHAGGHAGSGGTTATSGGSAGASSAGTGASGGGSGGSSNAGGSANGGGSAGGSAGASAGSAGGGMSGSGPGGSAGMAQGGRNMGGRGGTNSGGSGGATGGMGGRGGSGGTGGGSCDAPPALSPLVGWASVSGGGVTTTTGGGSATPVVVTTLDEFNNAVKGTTAAVVYVKGKLAAGKMSVGSNKTIAGVCGAEIHGHLELSGSTNVIISNLKIVGYGVGDCSLDPDYDSGTGCSSGNDAVTVQKNAHHVWFDHCDISDGTDGNLDITNGANYVTVSWTKFHYTARSDNQGDDSTGASGHRFSNLIGGTDNPSSYDDANALNVTWHHDYWADHVVERQPRVRFGKNHLYNNVWASSGDNYCVRAGKQARILIESSVFSNVKDPYEFNNDSDKASASITVKNNDTSSASGTMDTDGAGPAIGTLPYTYTPDAVNGVAAAVQSGAGPH